MGHPKHPALAHDPIAAIEHELQEERAYALGLAGKAVEAALLEVTSARPADLERLLDEAGSAVWKYLIVREALGLRDHREVLDLLGVPGRVLARVGILRRPSSSSSSSSS